VFFKINARQLFISVACEINFPMPSFICSRVLLEMQNTGFINKAFCVVFFLLFAFFTVDVEFVMNTDALMQLSLPGMFLSMIIRYSSISESDARRPGGVLRH